MDQPIQNLSEDPNRS